MWMQKSVEGASFSSSGNFHDRNRFGAPQHAQGSSYGGRGVPVETGDWKTKILESGQWLGGKVIEYGGKLARGPTTDAVPDQYAHQMPRNDGRANWMADIRSSSSSSSYAGGRGVLGGYSGGYQNDFATERPQMYSDVKTGYFSSHSLDSQADGSLESKTRHSGGHEKSRQAKKKQEGKTSKKKKRKSKKTRESESEEENESEEVAVSESSDVEPAADRRRRKTHGTTKKKKDTKKCSELFYSEESASESDQGYGKRKASSDYSFSFDPAKLPPPPPKDQQKVTTKKTRVKKDKAGKKAHSWQHSVASTDDESNSEKENLRKSKKRSSKKAGTAASCVSVDLLGVDLDVQPVAQPPTSGRPTHEMQLSVFDAPQSHKTPLQDLAGLSFTAPVQGPAPTQPSVFDGSASATASNEARVHSPSQIDAFRTTLLPENNLVDLSSLVREKKKTLSANPAEKRTLNDMQKARGMNQPTPVMAMPMQGQQQQNMSGSMMTLNMNQLQITNGATEIQQQMYPNLPMQHMAITAHPQLMNIQPTHSQQFVQGGMATAEPPRAANFTSSDPFRQAFMK